MRLHLVRTHHLKDRTLGTLYVIRDNSVLFELKTLELPWNDNKRNASCIPTGTYPISRRHSAKYQNHYIIENTGPRTYILIHYGNFPKDTDGCILVGTDHKDIDYDKIPDVINSKLALNKLLEYTYREIAISNV